MPTQGMGSKKLLWKLKTRYVDELKEKGFIKSYPVERAFREVPRHEFIEYYYKTDENGKFEYEGRKYSRKDFDASNPQSLEVVYSDRALLTRISPPSSTSQPSLVVMMLENLELVRGMNVLEIGTGTGYNAALMQNMVGEDGQVTTIDIQEDVVSQTENLLETAGYDKINLMAADGVLGCPKQAPYDRIVATVGCSDLSPAWKEQLAQDGFMLIPLQHGAEGFNPLTKILKEDSKMVGSLVGPSGFMSIHGELEVEQRLSFMEQEKFGTTEPLAEYPLFDHLTDREKSLCFLLFIGLVDGRASWDGFYDQKGAIKIKQHRLISYGGESLYQDFKDLYKQWEKLEKPGFSDWQLEFLPSNQYAPKTREEDRTWIIERKFFTEILRLESHT